MRAKSLRDRRNLVRDINAAFSPARIRRTARRLGRLEARSDFLDITNALGFLDSFTGGDLRRYKRELTIPEHIRRFVTLAFRAALGQEPGPMPLRIAIVSGRTEAARIDVTDRRISVTLTRRDVGVARSRR
jgi:hypothetical protein